VRDRVNCRRSFAWISGSFLFRWVGGGTVALFVEYRPGRKNMNVEVSWSLSRRGAVTLFWERPNIHVEEDADLLERATIVIIEEKL
jgi:hypothetical protein